MDARDNSIFSFFSSNIQYFKKNKEVQMVKLKRRKKEKKPKKNGEDKAKTECLSREKKSNWKVSCKRKIVKLKQGLNYRKFHYFFMRFCNTAV